MLLNRVNESVKGCVVECPFAPLVWRATARGEHEFAGDGADRLETISFGREHLPDKEEMNRATVPEGSDLDAHAMVGVLRELPGELLEDNPGAPGIESLGRESASGNQSDQGGEKSGR